MELAIESSVQSASTQLRDLSFIAFDVETTGLSAIACKLVELSAVRFNLIDNEMEIFSTLIDPECQIPPEVTRVHGITDEMVKGAPMIREVASNFLEFIGSADSVLLAHNAPFDVGFLRVALAKLGMEVPAHRVLDTLPMARCLVQGVNDYKLKTLVEHYEIADGDYHRALADSHHVRHIFNRMMSANPGIACLEDLNDFNCQMSLCDVDSFSEPTGEVKLHVNTIKTAIDTKQRLKLVYLGNGWVGSGRLITPLAVLENRGNHYLTAFCHQADAERTFRIDRIKSLKVFC